MKILAGLKTIARVFQSPQKPPAKSPSDASQRSMPVLPAELYAEIFGSLNKPEDFHAAALVCRNWRHIALAPAVLSRHLRQNGMKVLPETPEALLRASTSALVAPGHLAAGTFRWCPLSPAQAAAAASQTVPPRSVPVGDFERVRYSVDGEWALTVGQVQGATTTAQVVSIWDLRSHVPTSREVLSRAYWTFSVNDFAISNGGKKAVLHADTMDAVFRRQIDGSYSLEILYEGHRSFVRSPSMVAIANCGEWAILDKHRYSPGYTPAVQLLDLRKKKTQSRLLSDLPYDYLGIKYTMDFRDVDSRIVLTLSDRSFAALDFGVREPAQDRGRGHHGLTDSPLRISHDVPA